MKRGEIWWADLGEPSGSEAGYRRPVLIVSANGINDSTLKTILTVPLTANLNREYLPTSVRLSRQTTGLSKPAVALLHLVTATNKLILTSRSGRLPEETMTKVDSLLRLVLGLF
jgi:mRNA interferase MazF